MSILILALDTSHSPGSVCVSQGHRSGVDVVLCESLPHAQKTANSFAPLKRDMLRSIRSRPMDVGLVAVDTGPGSFTGLRIAVTFAKTFAYATGSGVLGISSMDVLAHQAAMSRTGPIPRLWTLVDAHRGQLFAALYASSGGGELPDLSVLHEPRMIEIESWRHLVEPGDVVTGPVVDRLASRLPAGVESVDEAAGTPAAPAVAQLAWQRWLAGDRDDLWQLRPIYIRRSAAEERRDAAGGATMDTTAPQGANHG